MDFSSFARVLLFLQIIFGHQDFLSVWTNWRWLGAHFDCISEFSQTVKSGLACWVPFRLCCNTDSFDSQTKFSLDERYSALPCMNLCGCVVEKRQTFRRNTSFDGGTLPLPLFVPEAVDQPICFNVLFVLWSLFHRGCPLSQPFAFPLLKSDQTFRHWLCNAILGLLLAPTFRHCVPPRMITFVTLCCNLTLVLWQLLNLLASEYSVYIKCINML